MYVTLKRKQIEGLSMATMSNNCKPDPYADELRFHRCPQAMRVGL